MAAARVVGRSGQPRSDALRTRLAPLSRWSPTGVWDVLQMSPQACLHVGCYRQHPVINVADLLKARLHTKSQRVSAATVDPIVAAAIAQATAPRRNTSIDIGTDGMRPPCLLLGVDMWSEIAPSRRYPGMTITANTHHTEVARMAIQRVIGAQCRSAAIEPMFDLLVSDTLSPLMVEHSEGGGGVSPLRPSSAVRQVPNAIAAIASDTPDTLVPFQACREPVVVCPVRASLAVGLPFLKAGGAVVVRASYHHHTDTTATSSVRWDGMRRHTRAADTQVRNLNALVADLRYRFGVVDLHRDAHGMVIVAAGESGHAVGDMPHNLREDFPGFSRDVRRPRQWNPLEPRMRGAKQQFFMALHPAFDRAPPPSAVEFGLAQEKVRAEYADQQGEAFDDLVSRTLDEFKKSE